MPILPCLQHSKKTNAAAKRTKKEIKGQRGQKQKRGAQTWILPEEGILFLHGVS